MSESRQNATAHFLLAALDLAEERFSAARGHLEATLAIDPGNAVARAWLDSLARARPH